MPARGFTLVEVLLAIGVIMVIATGLMVLYQQAVDGRARVVRHAEKASNIRTFMDQMTREIRTSRTDPGRGLALRGSESSIEFLTTALPLAYMWTISELDGVPAGADARLVGYRLDMIAYADGSSDVGLVRSERMLAATGNTAFTASQFAQPVSEYVRFLRFRYWDGANWITNWTSGNLPGGIEVTVGFEYLPEDTDPADYPYFTYKRVISLPATAIRTIPPDDPDLLLFPQDDDLDLGMNWDDFDWDEDEEALP